MSDDPITELRRLLRAFTDANEACIEDDADSEAELVEAWDALSEGMTTHLPALLDDAEKWRKLKPRIDEAVARSEAGERPPLDDPERLPKLLEAHGWPGARPEPPDHQALIRQLGEAMGRDLPAMPHSPEYVWRTLLSDVRRDRERLETAEALAEANLAHRAAFEALSARARADYGVWRDRYQAAGVALAEAETAYREARQ